MDKIMNCQLKLDLQPKGMGGETAGVMLPSLEYSEESVRNKARETMSAQDGGKPRQTVPAAPFEPEGISGEHPAPYDPASTRFCQTSHWKPGGRFLGDGLPGAGECSMEDLRWAAHRPRL